MKITLLALAAHYSMATLTPSLPRGEKIVEHKIGSSNRAEICVIPKKIAGGDYSKGDLEDETELCDLNASVNAAVCGKIASTNPAVEFFKAPSHMSVRDLETKDCSLTTKEDPQDELKKLAKYKLSTSCSYTPSLLAYYHLSRYFGDINDVPAAVLRTMDRNRHIAIGEETLKNLKAKGDDKDIIALTWGSLLSFLKAGQNMSKKDKMHGLFTDDFTQSYGALQKNPRGEEKYSETYPGGKDQAIRAQNFRNHAIYKTLTDNRPLANIVSNRWEQENVQKVRLLQNTADMLIMDFILSQEDRFGNIHYTEKWFYVKDGKKGKKIEKDKKKKLSAEEARQLGAVLVKDMMLKDNDCGVNRTNHQKNAGLLGRIAHVNPETYKKLLKLEKDLATEEMKEFFKKETLMLDSDYSKLRANVSEAVRTLKSACQDRRLHLDLDLSGHFLGDESKASCE